MDNTKEITTNKINIQNENFDQFGIAKTLNGFWHLCLYIQNLRYAV